MCLNDMQTHSEWWFDMSESHSYFRLMGFLHSHSVKGLSLSLSRVSQTEKRVQTSNKRYLPLVGNK